jgi:predicted dehydrogenase
VIHGRRHDKQVFQVLPVPEEYWGEVDRTDTGQAMIPGPFVTEPVGARLFVEAILDDRPVSPSFYDGYKVAAVVEAALASQRSGRWITL